MPRRPPTALPNTFAVFRALDNLSWQSLLDYASSRLRSIAMAWVSLKTELPEAQSEAFLSYFITEIGIGSYLTGYGVVLHGSVIHIPPALSGLVRALTKDSLSDMQVSLDVLMDRRNRSDDLLEFYVGNWWSGFGRKEDQEDPTQSVEFTIDCWKAQQRNLVPFVNVRAINHVNLADLNRKELEEAYSVAADSVNLLELEYEKITGYLSELTINITKLQTLKKDLNALQLRYVSQKGRKDGKDTAEGHV